MRQHSIPTSAAVSQQRQLPLKTQQTSVCQTEIPCRSQAMHTYAVLKDTSSLLCIQRDWLH